MSVPKGKRQESKLEVLNLLHGLCTYTVQITKNEKNFPKRDRWVLTAPIVKEAVLAYTHARKANAVKVVTVSDYEYRRGQQVKARAAIEALIGLIEIAYTCLSLEGDRVEYWVKYAMSCEEQLAKWRASDRKRYAKIFKNSDETGNG